MSRPMEPAERTEVLFWWRRILSSLGDTFASVLQYRDYRKVWLGSVSEHMGEWMEMVALNWLETACTTRPSMKTIVPSR